MRRNLWRRNQKRTSRTARQETSIVRQIVYGVISITAVILVCVLVWYLTRMPSVTLGDVVVAGGETISHEMVQDVVERELVGTYYLLVPKRFVYMYPRERIIEALNDVPRLHNVTLGIIDDTTLSVNFDEYMPHALWCLSEEDDSACYFLSREGYAFSPAPPLRGGALTRYIIEEKEDLSEQQVIEPALLGDIEEFLATLAREFGFRVHTVTYTSVDDLVYHLSGGAKLLVSTDIDSEETLENLKSILESDEFSHLESNNFNYIDLRFGSKVFVNEEIAVPEEETASGTAGLNVLLEPSESE